MRIRSFMNNINRMLSKIRISKHMVMMSKMKETSMRIISWTMTKWWVYWDSMVMRISIQLCLSSSFRTFPHNKKISSVNHMDLTISTIKMRIISSNLIATTTLLKYQICRDMQILRKTSFKILQKSMQFWKKMVMKTVRKWPSCALNAGKFQWTTLSWTAGIHFVWNAWRSGFCKKDTYLNHRSCSYKMTYSWIHRKTPV